MTKRWIIMLAVCAVCLAMQETVHAGIIEEGGWQFNIVENDDLIAVDFEVLNSSETNMTEIKLIVKQKEGKNVPSDYKWNAVICGEDPNLDFKKEEEVTKFFFFKTKEETDLENVDLSEEQYKIDNKIPDKWCDKTKRKGYPFKLSETEEAFEKEIIIKVPVNVTEFRMYVGNGSVVIDAGALDTDTTKQGSNRQICKDSNGRLHVAYRGINSDLYYGNSTDGATWTYKLLVSNTVSYVGIVCTGEDDLTIYYQDNGYMIKGINSTNGGTTFGSVFTIAESVGYPIASISCESDANKIVHCCHTSTTRLYYTNLSSSNTITVNDNVNDQTDTCTLVVSPNNCVYILAQGVDHDDLDYWSKCLNGFGDGNRVEIGAGGGYATGSTISAAMVNKSGTLKMYAVWVDSGDLQFCEGTPGSAFSCSEIYADPSYFPSLVASDESVEILYLDYATMDSNADLNKAYSLTDSISFTVTRGILTASVYYPQSRGSWFPSFNRATTRHDFIYQDDGDLYFDYLSISGSGVNSAPTTPTDISGFPASLTVGNVLNVTASGSTDVDGDPITYYYKVYNLDDGVIKKNWSTTKTYTVQSSDLEDYLVVYAKAGDGTANSSEYSEFDYVGVKLNLFAGQGEGSGDGDIFKFNGSSWNMSYSTSSYYRVFSLFEYNNDVYAGMGAIAGQGDVLKYSGGSWAVSYNGAEEEIDSFAVYGGNLYAGQGSGGSNGDIYKFNGTHWSLFYDTAYEEAKVLLANGSFLYAGFGSGSGDGDIWRYNGTTWTKIYENGLYEYVFSLEIYNNKLYAGMGSGATDGDIIVYNGTSGSLSYNGASARVQALKVYNNKLYAGVGYGAGLGDIIVFNGSTWTTSYNGTEDTIYSLTTFDGNLYAGQGYSASDGDVLKFNGTHWTTDYAGGQETMRGLYGQVLTNTAPSAPSDITGFPTTLFVGNVLNVTASGAYDANGDTLTYYYKFYNVNDTTIRQDWSTTKTYTTQASDTNDVIRVYTKAYDGALYSGEYYEDDIVEVGTIEFAIGYPSTGCTSGNGSTDEDVACERCAFVTTDLTGAANQTQRGCEGQDSSTGFYVISNTGNVAVSWRVKMNASINTAKFRHKVALTSGGYQATCSGNVTTGCAYVENTTQKLLVSNLAVDGQSELWAWADFINVYPSDTATYTMTSNVTQT